MSKVKIGTFEVGEGAPLAVIAGPCVIESTDHCLRVAESAIDVCRKLGVPYVFKASFDKANRTSVSGFRGPGLEEGLGSLEAVRNAFSVPVLTDIHLPEQADAVAQVCDILQIPAFLCRQTDLLMAAGRTGRVVNIKKGQFMAPEQMGQAVAKVTSAGGAAMLTDRGTFFGYGRLVNDFTGIPIMRRFAPAVIDATHSCQIPGGMGDRSGGLREHVPVIARAGVASGADVLFLEIHDHPEAALSDSATVYPLDQLERLLGECLRISEVVRGV
ncbi:MAG TPA: 3-deoxy-8-phosphooctulonate synthase [Phycisphaerae bacterium]|nr:3-deoxy-8-phosphooctulonate synthase [Phycisphaerae bacterium]HRW52845.1 3-deoxy-8-phosphooctulonate synthase [Phycisphaerae bacterium]